jgi:hypothetical protein
MRARKVTSIVVSAAWIVIVALSHPVAAPQLSVRTEPPPPRGSIQVAYVQSRRQLLYEQKFDVLDAEADGLLAAKSRFPGGDWKLYRFFGAVGRPNGGYGDLSDRSPLNEIPFVDEPVPTLQPSEIERAWQHHISLLRRWQSSRPDSPAAVLALADALVSYGWNARGGWADTVTSEQAKLFHERLTQAEHLLSEHRRAVSRNPHFACVMIDIVKGQARRREEVYAVVRDAVATEPLYLHVYSAAARALTPRWLGDRGEWERFADEVSRRIGGREGSVIYGHINMQVGRMYGMRAFLGENVVSWPRIKQGFADREDAYGSSPELLNAVALFAGTVGDQKVAHDAFAKVGDNWDMTLWRERRYFDSYRQHALAVMR